MPLQSGTRIGGYEISARIGAGGMGEVYRARDLRLGRDVAIKVLSPNIAADADALMRFDREARALASLNHPNIGGILGVEDYAHQPALVLELVDGETLADRIAAGSIPASEAIDYAKQIADALDVAHEAGIVHRDLKPGNIKITEDGRIKILDFGLAKAIAVASGESPDINPANSPTITVHGTQQGVILGTAAYMSPEQARGKRIDKRTDIWAFGCVLFEMLTGKRAFNGETTSDVIAAIIERTPDLDSLPRSTPPHVRRVLERCLEKDPKRRARDIADVRAELDASAAASVTPRRSLLIPVIALVAVVAVIAAIALWRSRPAPVAPPPPIEFTFGAPPGYVLAHPRGTPSPDGRYIAFVASDEKQVNSIFLRSLENGSSRRLEGTEGVNTPPAWSPDGRSIAFFVAGVWKRLSIDGGPAMSFLADVQANLGASWGADDLMLLSPGNRTALVKKKIGGGPLEPATNLDTERENSHRWPQLLPDGRHYLFTVRSDSPDRLGIKVGALDSSDTRMLVNVASQGFYAEPGWLVFVTPDQVVMAQPLDPATWTLQGAARPVAGPVRYNGGSFSGNFDVSIGGRVLTYSPASRTAATLEWFDRTGKPLGRVGPERNYEGVRLSLDGRTISVEIPDPQIGTRDIWSVDATTQLLSRLTTDAATDWRGVQSPDGKTLAFASDRAGASAVFTTAMSNAADQKPLLRMPGVGVFPVDWSRDGKSVLAAADDSKGRSRVVLKIAYPGGSSQTLLSEEQADLIMPRVSPEGDRLAYSARGSDRSEVYVTSLRDRTRVQVSLSGGSNPVWGPDGKELFFVNPRGELMRAALAGMSTAGVPQTLFHPCQTLGRSFIPQPTVWTYDASADGQRFLMICQPQENLAPSGINVIVNWQGKLTHP